MKKYSIYFLAHGGYFEKKDVYNGSFTLPENIRLITYSPPTKLLDAVVAKNIIEQLEENPFDIPNNVTIYSGYTNGEIYKSELNPIIRKGGTSITNMRLKFTNDIPGFDMNIFVLENNTKKVIEIGDFDNVDLKDTNLETIIEIIKNYISNKSPEMDDDEIIDVNQISCHEGDYFDIKKATPRLIQSAIEDLTNQMDKTLVLDDETKDTTEFFKKNPLNETRPRTIIVSEDIELVKKEVEEYEKIKQKHKSKKRTLSNIDFKFFPEKHKQTKRRYDGGKRKNSRRKACSRKNKKK
jgi:hypothetical protein